VDVFNKSDLEEVILTNSWS